MRIAARTLALVALGGWLLPRPLYAAKAFDLPPAQAYGARVPRHPLCASEVWPRRVDGALCDAAHLLARRVALGLLDPGTPHLARWAIFLAHRQGVAHPSVRARVIRTSDYVHLYDRLEREAAATPEGAWIGAGVAAGARGPVGVLLTVVPRIGLHPFPRRVRRKEGPEVTLVLPAGTRLQRVLLRGPGDDSQTLGAPRVRGEVHLRLPPLVESGTYVLQVMIDRGAGPEVALQAPLLVEAPEPVGPAPTPPSPPADAALAWLQARVDDLRRSRSMPALVWDPRLAAVAAERARTLAAEGRVVHRPASGRDARTLLDQRDYRYRFFAEDLAFAPTVAVALASLFESPSHRQALLDARADHLGAAFETTGGGVYLVVLLAAPVPPEPQNALTRRVRRQRALLALFERISSLRRAAHLPPPLRDPDLDEVAQVLAERLAAAGRRQAPEAAAQARSLLVRRGEGAAPGVFVDLVVGPDVASAARAPAATDPTCKALGLGSAEGRTAGRPRVWVVLLCLPVR